MGMNKVKSLVLAVALPAFIGLSARICVAAPPQPPEGYKWVPNEKFSDEFNGAALDTSKWHDHHPRWKGRPPAKFMPYTLSLKDGMLQIKNGVLNPADGRFTIAGGAVVSKSSEGHFGYYEVRMKASKISMSSTFWFSNEPQRYGDRHIAQELDVQEAVGGGKKHPDRKHYMKSNTHVWVREGGKTFSKAVPGDALISPAAGEAFHVYGVWWVDAGTVHFYHNDEFKFTLHPNTDYHPTPFERPMHLNLVTETYDWETPPTPEELNDDSINTTYYDWVRAYVLVKDGDAPAVETPAFPYGLPDIKPDRPLSAAMERLYTEYPAVTPEKNELFSNFKYTQLEGFDYHNHDGTVSRRDPTKIIRVGGKYYVWYTHRQTPTPPKGAALGTDTVPSSDWDLAEIWYATSDDGFKWQEQGLAVPRPPKPQPGWRSVCTPDILVWKGKYYLYYQGFLEMSGTHGDDCPVTASAADSPEGPWRPAGKIIIPNGAEGEWDHYSIHDPYPLVYRGKIYLYYKSDMNGKPTHIRVQGLAIADNPFGPFTKHPLNPVINSGHETTLFPFKEGIAALVIRHGLEHNTIQFAPDGVHFRVATTTSLMPTAGGPYVPDAFTDTKDGRGITWGLCHFTDQGTRETRHSILARFDCDLSQDLHDEWMKKTEIFLKSDVYFSQGLSKKQRERIENAARQPQEE